MPTKKTLPLLCAAAIGALPALAQAENYAGLNLSFSEVEADGVRGDVSPTGVYGRLGGETNEYLSGEVRLGTGIRDDSLAGVDVEIETLVGAYVRAGIPNQTMFFPYAIVGYTHMELDASGRGFSASASESDVSFGIGADFDIHPTWKVNVEYMNFLDKSGVEIDGINVGVSTTF